MCVSQLLSRRLLAGWTLALLITIAATVGVMWVLQRPVHRIVSSSMAPHWLGPHIEFPCDDCGYHLHLDTSLLTVATPLRCPNCAHELGDLPRRLSRGDAIDVRAWRPEERPARWQTVVFRSDNGLESLEMKRIVGLPGEVVSIVAGDVLVDGLRPTRSLQQFRDMAVPVYDDRFRAQRTKSPDRWVPVEMNTRWQVVPDGLRCEGGKDAINESKRTVATKVQQADWIAYRHIDVSNISSSQELESPIDDGLAFDLLSSARRHYVNDLLIQWQLFLTADAWTACQVETAEGRITVCIMSSAGKITLLQSASEVSTDLETVGTADYPGSLSDILVEFAIFDGRIVLAIDGRVIMSEQQKTASFAGVSSSRPIRFAGAGAAVRIENIRIWRDIYFLDPQDANHPWSMARSLGPDEYFALGDNPSVSVDSRQRHEACPLSRKLLLGKALRFSRRPG